MAEECPFVSAIMMELGMSNSHGRGPFTPFACIWQHRQLLRRLIERDIATRFKGSVLGKLWAALLPLAMLALYTVVFGVIIQPRWQDAVQSPKSVALHYFAGLIVFNFFIECVTRAPTLMLGHATYIKKILFPVEVLAWMVLGGAAFRLIVSSGLLLVFYLIFDGVPPASAIAAPLVIFPLALFTIGMVWLLSAVGVFLRDIDHMVAAVTPAIMFLSPVFFPVAVIPEKFQAFFYANPLTPALENVRAALFAGSFPAFSGFVAYCLLGWMSAWLGYLCFMKLRPGFADVI